MDDFLKRFRALAYDHPWHSFPFLFGMMFMAVSTAEWSLQVLVGLGESHSFLYRMAFSGSIALFVHFLDRSREARSRLE